MCQLTYVNLFDPSLNSFFLTYQLLLNSTTQHKDGTGVSSYDLIYKSEKEPKDCKELNKEILEIAKDGLPLMGHVRKATTTNGVKIISNKFTHPFVGSKYILAHNGTLELQDAKKMESYTDKIDSQIFLETLEETEGDLLEALPKAMKLFYGKFAFLIHDKDKRISYVVRGTTADLHISYMEINGERAGYVINTSKLDLEKSTGLVTPFSYQILGEQISFTPPVLLEKNSIFVADEFDVHNIGSVEENYKPAPVTTFFNRGGGFHDRRTGTIIPFSAKDNKSLSETLLTIYDSTGLSLEELDTFFWIINGSPITSSLDSEISHAILVLQKSVFDNHSPMKKNLWNELINKSKTTSPISVYARFSLNFPYYMNSISQLTEAIKLVETETDD